MGGNGQPKAVLTMEDVSLNRGSCAVLRRVSLEVGRGELVAIMGPSGVGKTTILRSIAGLDVFDAGAILIDGVTLVGGAPPSPSVLTRLRRKVGMVFQFHCLFEHLTAIQNVCLAPVHAHGMAPPDAYRRAHDLLATFGVDHRADALPRHLSGGEAQRVAIARALAVDPPVLLMDEPTASLDPGRRAELGALVRELIDQGRTLVIATHDEEFAAAHATRIVRMTNGSLA
jgi:ABC-type polar amino acid transport system ATPase subunit